MAAETRECAIVQIVIVISLFGTCLSQIVASAADAYYIHEHAGPDKRYYQPLDVLDISGNVFYALTCSGCPSSVRALALTYARSLEHLVAVHVSRMQGQEPLCCVQDVCAHIWGHYDADPPSPHLQAL